MISDALVKYVRKSRILKTLADTKIKNAFSAQQNRTKLAPNKKYSAANNLLHIFPYPKLLPHIPNNASNIWPSQKAPSRK